MGIFSKQHKVIAYPTHLRVKATRFGIPVKVDKDVYNCIKEQYHGEQQAFVEYVAEWLANRQRGNQNEY